jgi:hypothetical protein
VLLAVVGGCAGPSLSLRQDACRMVRDDRGSIMRADARELYELSRFTPAEADARSAYLQRVTALSLGWIGGAALLVGLIDGFATDPATQPDARNAAYGLAGGALATILTAWILSYTSHRPAERARETLRAWADHCQ